MTEGNEEEERRVTPFERRAVEDLRVALRVKLAKLTEEEWARIEDAGGKEE